MLDLEHNNLAAIQSLIAQRANGLMKTGLSRSRARIQAADEIAATLNPPTTGQALDSWIGKQIGPLGGRGKSNGKPFTPPTRPAKVEKAIFSDVTPAFQERDDLDFPEEKKANVWGELYQLLKELPIGKKKALEFDSRKTGESASTSAHIHCRRRLACEANGWKLHTLRDSKRENIFWFWKEKA